MTDFGITPEGFVRKTIEDIVGELEADQIADIADDLDVSTDSIPGQFNGIFGRQLGICWELLEILCNSNDPDAAEDRLLEMLCKLTGTFRRGSTPSVVTLTCNLDSGTILLAGESFASVTDKPDIRWSPVEDYTAVADGPVSIVFQSELLGPIPGFAGTIAVIATPTVGWNTVVNPEDAEEGLNIDTDPELRIRREREIATVGSATVDAIEANLSQAFPDDLIAVIVFENESDVTDSDGRPPHSIEALIFDGTVPTIDDDELAQVIYDSKAGGIQTYGASSGEATTVVNGDEVQRTVNFSRADELTTYLTFTLDKGPGYVGDTAVKAYVAEQANRRFGPGDDVIAIVLAAMPLSLAGVRDVALTLGFSASPVGTSNLTVGVREMARFDTTRIVIV